MKEIKNNKFSQFLLSETIFSQVIPNRLAKHLSD